MENTHSRIDKLTREVQEIKSNLEFSQAEIEDLKHKNDLMENNVKASKSGIDEVNSKLNSIGKKIEELESKTDDLKNRSRRNNLCFDGIKEDARESWSDSEKKIKDLLASKFNIATDNFTVERAHRIGRRKEGKPRMIVAKFQSYKTKETILKKKSCLKGTNMFIREDFSDKTLAKRKELLPKMHEERKKGNIAFLRFDKLVVYPRSEDDTLEHFHPMTSFPWKNKQEGSRGRGQVNISR